MKFNTKYRIDEQTKKIIFLTEYGVLPCIISLRGCHWGHLYGRYSFNETDVHKSFPILMEILTICGWTVNNMQSLHEYDHNKIHKLLLEKEPHIKLLFSPISRFYMELFYKIPPRLLYLIDEYNKLK
jgi:hypothetical protein